MQINIIDSAEDVVIYNITGASKEELDNKLNLFFSSEGYRFKSEVGETRTYEKGNRTLRILFGAFVKYNKQSVTIKNQADFLSLRLYRESTGISGGLIGMNQVKKEFHRLTEAFKTYFSK